MPSDGHGVGDGDGNAADAYCVGSKVVGVLVPAPTHRADNDLGFTNGSVAVEDCA